ncbi:MAG: DUF938 domain-containing protein [Pseudomonadales bacterium]
MEIQNFSQAAANNQLPILQELKKLQAFQQTRLNVLEIGSGSGQHAIYFTSELPHIHWQPSDQGAYFEGLQHNLREFTASNIAPPLYIDLTQPTWPSPIDVLYAANVIHIMPERLLPQMFASPANLLLFYGPYKYQGQFTTESNANFDQWLKARNPESGIRDMESLLSLGEEAGYQLVKDQPMPANNQFLVFQRD